MPTLTIPNSFSPNTVGQSSKVNANFQAVATFFNSTKIDNSNIQTGGIIGSNIAANTITGGLLNSNVVDGGTLAYASNTIKVNDGGVGIVQVSNAVFRGLTIIGTVAAYAGNPTLVAGGTLIAGTAGAAGDGGWLLCDGAAISRVTFGNLFGVISTTYGVGNGTTTFNVPDFRGTFLRGADLLSGVDVDASTRTNLGSGTYYNPGSTQGDQFKGHTHTQTSNVDNGSSTGGYTRTTNNTTVSGSNSVTGSTGGNQTNPINTSINYMIRF